jgi:hypothetical protein
MATIMRRPVMNILRVMLFGAATCLVACESHADVVCENIAACTNGGDHDVIKRCQDEAKQLKAEANQTGCAHQFADYYSCADDHYTCHGNTASFPSCNKSSKALSDCLAKKESNTACGELTTRRASCVPAADSGTSDDDNDAGPALPEACNLNRQCQARCYLDATANICAPTITELTNITDCTSACPP